MANKKNWLVIVLTLGIIVVGFNGCSKNVDHRLNGTWKGEYSITKYNSGNYEGSDEDGNPSCQGTYTTSDGKMTSTISHFFETDFGHEPRWYSKDELVELKIDYGELFDTYTTEYTVDGNTLTFIHEGEPYTMTLVSRDGRFTKAASSGKKSTTASSDKKSTSVVKSSGRASAIPGRWSLEDGPEYNNPEEMDLLKDGTGIVDGTGITWKIENGRLYLINPLFGFSSIYNVSGSTLKLTTDDDDVLIYKKKQ